MLRPAQFRQDLCRGLSLFDRFRLTSATPQGKCWTTRHAFFDETYSVVDLPGEKGVNDDLSFWVANTCGESYGNRGLLSTVVTTSPSYLGRYLSCDMLHHFVYQQERSLLRP